MWHTEIVEIVIIITMIDNNLFPGLVDSGSYLTFFFECRQLYYSDGNIIFLVVF